MTEQLHEPGAPAVPGATSSTRPLPPPETSVLAGWGRSAAGACRRIRARSRDDVGAALDWARRKGLTVGLRGGGNAYGDAALNAGGLVLDVSGLQRVLSWDPEAGAASVEPGVTIAQLWRHTIADGWWPSVVPGTSLVTLGGAAAANIHGKNDWKLGPLGDHVERVELVLADGSVRLVESSDPLFEAVIGSFGLLGAITRLDVRLTRVHSGWLDVEPVAAGSLAELIARLEERRDHSDYLVGWIDGFATGAALGRGLLHAARYLAPGEDDAPAKSLRVEAQARPDRLLGVLPRTLLWRAMRPFYNAAGMRGVNLAKYLVGRLEAGRRYRQSHAAFAFLLDAVPHWGLAYGRHGMIQYQSFVPEERAHDVFCEQLERAQRRGLVPMLGVFKRHRQDRFLLTHGVDGYSLALDFRLTASNRERIWQLTAELDRLVDEADGRFYLAKDSTLSPESAARLRADPRTERFLAWKRELDPESRLETQLARRVLALG